MAEPDRIISLIIAKLTIRNVTLGLITYVMFLVMRQIIYYRFLSPIKDFPGPFLASTTRLWLAWHNFKSTEIATVEALHKTYGELD